MENRGTFALAVMILLTGFFASGITGQAATTFPSFTGVSNYNTVLDGRYAKGNVDRDAEGFIDSFDLKKLKDFILIREYDSIADMDEDGDVDWDDYNTLADYIKRGYGSGYIIPRGGTCSLGETKCAREGPSGTGALYVCRENEIGAPEFMRELCPGGMRCRNGVCEYKVATVESFQRLSHWSFLE